MWDFPTRSLSSAIGIFSSQSPKNAAPQMGYHPLGSKCKSNSVVGISPARRNNLQEPQTGFHPLRNRDILLLYHSRTILEQGSQRAGQHSTETTNSNKSNNSTNSMQARSKWFLFTRINFYMFITDLSSIMITSNKQVQDHMLFCEFSGKKYRYSICFQRPWQHQGNNSRTNNPPFPGGWGYWELPRRYRGHTSSHRLKPEGQWRCWPRGPSL